MASRDNSVMAVLRRRLWLMLGVFVLVGGAVAAALMTPTPIFEAASLVVLEPERDDFPPNDSDLPRDDELTVPEVEVITSPPLVSRLGYVLALDRSVEFNPGLIAEPRSREVAANVRRAIRAERRGLTYVIEIAARSRSPQQAAAIANTLADIYIQINFEARIDAHLRANEWLENRIRMLRDEVEAKERAVEAYREEHCGQPGACDDDATLREIERDAEASRNLYESFLQRWNELGGDELPRPVDARLVSHAQVPAVPIEPKLWVALLTGLAAGLTSAITAALLAEALSRSRVASVRTP